MQELQGFVFGLVGMGTVFGAFLTMINSWKKEGTREVRVERDIEVEMYEPVSLMKTTDKQLVKLRRIEI